MIKSTISILLGLLLFVVTHANAAPVQVSFNSLVDESSPIFLTGNIKYDDSVITGTGSEYVALDSDDLFSLVIQIGSTALSKTDDALYGSEDGFPRVNYFNGTLLGLDFIYTGYLNPDHDLIIFNDKVEIYDNLQDQTITEGAISYSAVPIPATAWLFLSGLGLLSQGFAKKPKNQVGLASGSV